MSRESPFLSREPLSGEEHQPEVADLSQPGTTLIQQKVDCMKYDGLFFTKYGQNS